MNSMPEAGRAPVVKSGLEHSGRAVRHKAARAIILVPADEQGSLLEKAEVLSLKDPTMKAILDRHNP